MKKSKKNNTSDVITTIVALSVLVIALFGFTYFNFTKLNEDMHILPVQQAQDIEQEGISPELVCMVNDAYMGGKKQIPVAYEGKTYYGCCQMCVGRIQNDAQVRYATDPYSGEVIDKSEAFIILQPGIDNQVSYYKSEANFHLHHQSLTK